MALITLLTDFGLQDGFPAVMKGVIWNITPQVLIVDISHGISPQQVMQAALLLGRCAPYFPSGTIHVGVVDPGVGTSRRAIAAQLGEQFFVGPDNGLITLLLERAENNHQEISFVKLDKPAFWLPDVSKTFHGRDIFAPVAAYLAMGISLEQIGSTMSDPKRLTIPQPRRTTHGWLGQVIYIDHFGNLSTNIQAKDLESSTAVMTTIKGVQISGMATAFGEYPSDKPIVLIDSSGALAISVVNGSAAKLLNSKVGDQVEVLIKI
jgi:S-adenosylmethionine hydrolase